MSYHGSIAFIPARGGSKRIPNKNIKNFCGKPIISYSIQAAIKTVLFDKIVVSTDSHEIAEIAVKYGAEVPFIRPKELADDFVGTDEVIIHALNWLIEHGENVRYVCCIYATAPFIKPEYIKKGYESLIKEKATSAVSVTTYSYPIYRSLILDERGRLRMQWPEYIKTRSQDLPVVYHDAGQFYWADVKKYLSEKKLYSNDAIPVIIPRYLVQDIDTEEDWQRAELMYKALNLVV